MNANLVNKIKCISIYEPAAGCLTGACDPDQEDALAGLELAFKALKLRGVEVNRFNLGHDPEEFAAMDWLSLRSKNLACCACPWCWSMAKY